MSHGEAPPLRVLLLLRDLDIGGAEVAAYHLAEYLTRVGCRPVVCAWRRGGMLETRFRAAGVPLECPVKELRGWRRLHVPLAVRDILDRYQIDVIHALMSDSAVWAVLLQRLTGRPCVVSHHSNDLIDTVGRGRPLYGWARQLLLDFCARHAAANIAVSAAVRERLAMQTGLPQDRVTVVARGVPQPAQVAVEGARAQRQRRALSGFATGGGPQILYAGRLHEVKGLDTLVAAAPTVLKEFPTATFTLLGDGPHAAALHAQAQRLGIEHCIHFPGWVTDVDPWLAGADLYATASHVEGLSGAVLEAMSWGLPVVASDIAGHRELVRCGETGLLVPTSDPQVLAHTLIAALRDWPVTEARAARALMQVHEHYRVDLMAQRYLEVYRAARTAGAR